MAIKVPDNFRPSDYGIEISIPKPDVECEKNKDGSFSLRARYIYDGISGLAREAAREMNDKMEAELIDELLRLNGYVPYRTCELEESYGVGIEFDPFEGWSCNMCRMIVSHDTDKPNYCPNCGAKVVERGQA